MTLAERATSTSPFRASSTRRRPVLALGALLLAVPLAAVLDLVAGRALSIGETWQALTGGAVDPIAHHLVWRVRLPRVLVALGAGAGLGLAGLILQAALRNPLAAPEVTGVTPGAVLGAVAATGVGLADAASPATVVIAALAGGLGGVGVLWLLTGRARSDPAETAVYGVLVSAALGGLTAVTLLAVPGQLGSVVQWMVGTTEARTWEHWALLWPWTLGWAAVAWLTAGPLMLLRCGDQVAEAAGLVPARARGLVLLCAVALTAGAVAAVGALGFVGLVVPHAALALCGGDLRVALPGAALAGAVAVCGADAVAQLLSRAVTGWGAEHLSIPVGAVTTCVGAAVLLFVARRHAVEP
ncbi:FecCD family ABC transporter permease [Thermomonospora umbrina]|uniref:Iron complex transport system permease protein n=1 Tax=Thermomonospora umbrina TaxID=111806 RepID=A0A3D9SQM0_9ACTN|nr:iron chelate uptake ABC transporter family permease subunit [Thermomonospora umbrina]REE95235.1 iron complex transport system permease protein [Thermomonospora umbrina]